MTFTFVNDGKEVLNIMQCWACGHIQVERHFGEDGTCPMCQQDGAEKIDSQSSESGISEFQYRTLITTLEEETSGVGAGVAANIRDVFDGDEFIEACRAAYNEQEYGALTEISGVGETTARKICLSVADSRGWENGKAESKFALA